MASGREYLEFILEQLSGLENITWKAMMGEYIIYWRGKIIGGIYDDRFLVKPTKSAVAMMPDASRELPYEGAKEMLLVDNVDSREFLEELLTAMYDELPAPKKKKESAAARRADRAGLNRARESGDKNQHKKNEAGAPLFNADRLWIA